MGNPCLNAVSDPKFSDLPQAAKTIVMRMQHGMLFQCFDAWVGLLQHTQSVGETATKLFHFVTARLAAKTSGGVFQVDRALGETWLVATHGPNL